MEMSRISMCNMSTCVYNKEDRCHTPGITIKLHGDCNTFNHASAGGGFDEINGGVGACLASGCQFNEQLKCEAPNIDVATHDRHPDCVTFQPRK